jgi:hypothetical protein
MPTTRLSCGRLARCGTGILPAQFTLSEANGLRAGSARALLRLIRGGGPPFL